jgi:hypothetical protein
MCIYYIHVYRLRRFWWGRWRVRIFNHNLHIMFGFSRGGGLMVVVAAAEVSRPRARGRGWATRTRKDDGAQRARIYGRVFDFVIKLRFKCVALVYIYIYTHDHSRERPCSRSDVSTAGPWIKNVLWMLPAHHRRLYLRARTHCHPSTSSRNIYAVESA